MDINEHVEEFMALSGVFAHNLASSWIAQTAPSCSEKAGKKTRKTKLL